MWEGDWSIENPLGLVNDHFWKSGFCPPTEPGTQAPSAPVGWNKILLAALSFHRQALKGSLGHPKGMA